MILLVVHRSTVVENEWGLQFFGWTKLKILIEDVLPKAIPFTSTYTYILFIRLEPVNVIYFGG